MIVHIRTIRVVICLIRTDNSLKEKGRLLHPLFVLSQVVGVPTRSNQSHTLSLYHPFCL